MLGLSSRNPNLIVPSITYTASFSSVLLADAHNNLILLIFQLGKLSPREGSCLGKVV